MLHLERPVAGLDQQLLVVLPVQQANVDLGVELAQQAQLAVLRRYQRLLHRRQLDIEVVLGQVEVGREHLCHAFAFPGDREGDRFVVPADPVVVEEAGELLLRGMRELHAGMRGARASDQSRPLPDRAAPLLRDGGLDRRRQ